MRTGVVTQHLFGLIAKQVEDHRLVIWYDPDQSYPEAAKELELSHTTVARYDGSFFQLRHDIDLLLNDEQPPRLVVYVPADRNNTHQALLELEAAGVVLQPGQQPPNRNTRLAVMARNALKSILGERIASEIEKQVESGKLSLADLNALADKGKDISTGVLSLIFVRRRLKMWLWLSSIVTSTTERSTRSQSDETWLISSRRPSRSTFPRTYHLPKRASAWLAIFC